MFDIGSAVILGLVAVGLISLLKSLVWGNTYDRLVAVVCVVASVVAVLLVSASDFASEQVVLDRSLESLNFGSQLIVALLLSGLASGTWEAYRSVRNIGENHA
jgi:hypothetical protein